ncbi:hypothetical protein ElyMa_004207900 [Elysia marginata]|uniref:Uncharacterized protein n=1 Tax=Elysia marginata TaxID=1093978 RepID=A0AAV4GMP8_9GAST|nr:hypothetical protein ElyMa_004207900 [Elysia marginata]
MPGEGTTRLRQVASLAGRSATWDHNNSNSTKQTAETGSCRRMPESRGSISIWTELDLTAVPPPSSFVTIHRGFRNTRYL